jgi:hypothetical protein
MRWRELLAPSRDSAQTISYTREHRNLENKEGIARVLLRSCRHNISGARSVKVLLERDPVVRSRHLALSVGTEAPSLVWKWK